MKARARPRFHSPPRSSLRGARDRALAVGFTVGIHCIVVTLFLPRPASLPAQPVSGPSLTIATLLNEATPKPPRVPVIRMARDRHPVVAAALPRPVTAARVLAVSENPVPDDSDILSEAELAGAITAGEEGTGGGGACDTARAVQLTLRRDPMVQVAVRDAGRLGKATMVWNGDWVQSGRQAGKGLSAVREAIIWELAFAPEACRNERMHGKVLLSLADGGTRFAIGSGDWRWSDLLGVRKPPPMR